MANIPSFINYRRDFDDEVCRLIGEAYDAACETFQGNSNAADFLREVIAKRVIKAAKQGERDPIRLRSAALGALAHGTVA